MAPKQGTLKLVKSSQATLGKFFGKPNGADGAPKQQSKLAFGTKAQIGRAEKDAIIPTTPVEKGANASETGKMKKPKSATNAEVGEEDNIPEAASAIGETLEPSVAQHLDTPLSSPQKSRKRNSTEDLESDIASDDEPPTKRKRGSAEIKSQEANGKKMASKVEVDIEKSDVKSIYTAKKTVKKVSLDGKAKKEDGSAAKVQRKQTPKKAAASKSKTDEEEVPEDIDMPSVPLEITAKADPNVKSEESISDPDDLSESEDEKPDVAAKTREKVQSTLTSKGKDPYPDWEPDEAVPYAALCTTFSKIEMTTKRLEIAAHCSLFLRQVLRLTPKDLLPTVLLMVNKLAADYSGIELGIGESLIMKAIGESTGRSLAMIKTDQTEIGDLGLVAAKSRSNQPTMFKPKALTVRGVHDGLIAIAIIEGQGAQARKVGAIKKLLSAADAHLAVKGGKGIDITQDKGGPSEAKYIIRALEGKMRLGLAEKTVLVSLAQAMVTHEAGQKGDRIPSTDQLAKGEAILKAVFNELPSYEVVVPAMLEHGISHLRENCKLRPGVPLKPMLAKPTKSITEVLDRFEGHDFTCEYKYDGERAQIHFVSHESPLQYATAVPSAGKSDKGISNIFSRNSEDLSKKYPDILAKLPTWVKPGTQSFVLDCETVAWDMVERKVLPFQQLMTRKRKDVKVEDVKVKVCVFAFDLLFLDGEALVNRPFRERRDLMRKAFAEVEGEFTFAQYGNSNQLEEIQVLLVDSIKASCEGLMVKMLDGVESHYEPSRRSQNWLKVKKDYLAGVGDSLDLVVLGAYFGRGKRTSVYGAFLLACYNPATQNFETVCNIGTGFSEAVLEELHAQLSPIAIERAKPFYKHSAGNKDQPDVWFESKFVWEVLCADLTISPRYKAAADQLEGDQGGKGISLRFPRFLKIRDDKKPEDATTSRAIAEMYRNQGVGKSSKGPAADDDFEY